MVAVALYILFFVLLSPEIVIKNFKASFAGEPWFLKYNKVLDLIYQQTNELRVGKKENGESFSTFSVSVPHNEIFSNRFLEDLEKIWELRYYIPDPNKLEYANCDCAPCSRYKGEILQGW